MADNYDSKNNLLDLDSTVARMQEEEEKNVNKEYYEAKKREEERLTEEALKRKKQKKFFIIGCVCVFVVIPLFIVALAFVPRFIDDYKDSIDEKKQQELLEEQKRKEQEELLRQEELKQQELERQKMEKIKILVGEYTGKNVVVTNRLNDKGGINVFLSNGPLNEDTYEAILDEKFNIEFNSEKNRFNIKTIDGKYILIYGNGTSVELKKKAFNDYKWTGIYINDESSIILNQISNSEVTINFKKGEFVYNTSIVNLTNKTMNEEKIEQTSNKQLVSNDAYVVKRGDTLIKIAKMYNMNYKELGKLNNIENLNLIKPGQKIVIKYNAVTKGESSLIITKTETGIEVKATASEENKDLSELTGTYELDK